MGEAVGPPREAAWQAGQQRGSTCTPSGGMSLEAEAQGRGAERLVAAVKAGQVAAREGGEGTLGVLSLGSQIDAEEEDTHVLTGTEAADGRHGEGGR